MAKHTHVAKPRIDMINLYPLKPTYTERKANYTNSTTPTYQYIQTYIYRDISVRPTCACQRANYTNLTKP